MSFLPKHISNREKNGELQAF